MFETTNQLLIIYLWHFTHINRFWPIAISLGWTVHPAEPLLVVVGRPRISNGTCRENRQETKQLKAIWCHMFIINYHMYICMIGNIMVYSRCSFNSFHWFHCPAEIWVSCTIGTHKKGDVKESTWLVVDQPLCKILVSWDDYSQYMEKKW
jgi:hypothetical protein